MIERDGYIKVGKHSFYDDSGEVNVSLVNSLKNYIKIDNLPSDLNLDLIYYHFLKIVI